MNVRRQENIPEYFPRIENCYHDTLPPQVYIFFVPNELSTFIPHLLHSIQSLSLLQPSCSRQMSFYPPPHWRPPTHPTQPPPLGPVSASAVIFHRSASEAASPHLLPQVPPTSEAASAT